MELKDLNNQQLILLALLVSFITSIATGIVTVALMDQAPPGVTQTINRIVKETVKVITPEGNTKEVTTEKIIVKEEDFIVEAAQKNSANVVRIGSIVGQDSFRIGGLEFPSGAQSSQSFKASGGSGFVITTDGLLVTDKNLLTQGDKRPAVETLDGAVFDVNILAEGEYISLLQIVMPKDTGTSTSVQQKFSQVKLGNSDDVKIGQTMIALGADTEISLLLGVVSRVEWINPPSSQNDEPRKVADLLYTTMAATLLYSGGPLINTEVEVVGINIVKGGGEQFSVPSNSIKELLDEYRAATEEVSDKGTSGELKKQ